MAEDSTQERAAQFPKRYDAGLARRIEEKWQDYWEENQTFHAPNPGEPGFDPSRPKKFIMDMFPYPSGVGLHVGHPLGYIATDVYARYLRMCGFNVLHPMGYDAFGLPAEQYALQTGQHPRVTTERNIATMRAQMRRLGLGHDPQRSLATTDVEFYRWTQWIFLEIFESWYDTDERRARPIAELVEEFEARKRSPIDEDHNPDGRRWSELSDVERRKVVDNRRLAYVAELPVNWCPGLGTVLANEEVTAEGRSERGNFPVYKRPLEQWMLRITAYCERLLEDLETLDWPEPIKIMQRNWIGRSEGADADFLALSGPEDDPRTWFEERRKKGWPEKPERDRVTRVFTTRPDTLYGATYMVLAPEHPLVVDLVPESWPEGTREAWKGQFPGRPPGEVSPREMVQAYQRYAETKSDVDRQVETREKTGVFTGAFAANPVNSDKVPVFIADYVLMGYGTGAIMAVPAHDDRDCEFALEFELPIVPVVMPDEAWLRENVAPELEKADSNRDAGNLEALQDAYRRSADRTGELAGLYRITRAFTGDGVSVNSSAIEGLPTREAKPRIVDWLAERGLGKGAVNYRLRDWLFSRQRYWGEPFPILFDEHDLPLSVDASELPVELPEMDDYRPETTDDPESLPRPPLGRAKEWATVSRDGKTYRRELNTMPNWAGSCWYYLRYLDNRNGEALAAPDVERYWMLTARERRPGIDGYDPETCKIGGVDLYVGGAEHAVLHLLYSRFWHKVLHDLGHVSTPEPFQRLFNQGYVQAAAYKDERDAYVEANEVEERDGKFYHQGKEVRREFGKMGKSLKNAVTPDQICENYGADTLRLYEMYMGPLEVSKPWNTRDIVGVYRFLQRLWRNLVDEESGALKVDDEPASDDLRKLLHRTIDGVRLDMETLGFNTAIAKLIELNNQLTGLGTVPREVAEPLIKMLAPLAPHAAEELWASFKGEGSTIAYEPYPEADPALLVEDLVEIPVMVKGKVRARIQLPPGADPQAMEKAALESERIQTFLEGKSVKKVIAVPGRMVNIVI